jgi:hypothetical protein
MNDNEVKVVIAIQIKNSVIVMSAAAITLGLYSMDAGPISLCGMAGFFWLSSVSTD